MQSILSSPKDPQIEKREWKTFELPVTPDTIEKLTEVKAVQNDSLSYEKDMLNILEGSLKSSEDKQPTVIADESSDEEEWKVRFNDHILNEHSLNPSLIEWIWHN